MRYVATVGLLLAAPAVAQDDVRFCPSRPSLESSACTTLPGQLQLEVSAMDWQLERDGEGRTDTFLPGDFLARLGVGPATELQAEWSPVGIVREREAGRVESRTRSGDLRFAVRHAFAGADGTGLSYGVEPYVTIPIGGRPVGDGDWAAGAVVPVTVDMGERLTLGVTGEVDAAVDADGSGRHLAGSVASGVAIKVTRPLSLTLEAQWLRDDDPAEPATQWLAGAGATWQVSRTRALYVEALRGLNHATPDWRLYGGVAVLFH